jgi:hypothetical protein
MTTNPNTAPPVSTRAERKGLIFPGNPNRRQNACQAIAAKKRKQKQAARRTLHDSYQKAVQPLRFEEIADLPAEVIKQLSRTSQDIWKKGQQSRLSAVADQKQTMPVMNPILTITHNQSEAPHPAKSTSSDS